MRVISGKCRGTHLIAPEGMETRPTTDRIDLFSGSGGIGIESLSRGARKAVFVDQGNEAIACIKANLEKTRLTKDATVMQCSVQSAITKLHQQGEQFDIIFMDPPYALAEIDELLEMIAEKELLSEDGYIILERSTNRVVNIPQNLVLWKEKKTKTTTLSFIKKG